MGREEEGTGEAGKGKEKKGWGEGRGCRFGLCELNSNVDLQELQSQYIVSMQECPRTHPQQNAILKKLERLHLMRPVREGSNA